MLSESCRIYFHSLANVIGTSLLISVVFLWSLVVLIPLLITYYYTALYFRVTYRELKRLDSILRSHLYAHFSETLCGLSTIRAYNVQDQFLRNNENFMDQENRAYFLMAATIRWLCVRLGIIASVLIYCASLLSVIQRFEIEPAIIGFVLSHAMSLPDDVIRCVRLFAEVEANMNSVERLVHYSDNLESEAALIIPENQPSLSWPAKGEITIENLTMQYGSENPTVLKDITVHIKASEKVGIVGRTGCGKSTLATSFFRFIEQTSGKVIIDGIDITTIGLKDLRTKITIIPQEPVLFNGTIRSNLDPFNEYDDATLWNALQTCLMADKIDQDYCLEPDEKALLPANLLNNSSNPLQTEINLYSLVKECGINFSHGQKQLIALARALLRKSKLIIMDEATANLDHKTDQLIQNIIREMFGKSTIITIAHRLRTVINYDRILVMCDGRIVEDDSPYVLLQNPKSTFREMCKSSNMI
ncbi:ABC transporter [Gigaspora margarita]|uniref:ABC transporter n=1 Tax=Gigaspora margarita TaxID=4874 RepID=A0A8H4AI71_GIGMA|nr:ABC transporter [Gigaspora margarita]